MGQKQFQPHSGRDYPSPESPRRSQHWDKSSSPLLKLMIEDQKERLEAEMLKSSPESQLADQGKPGMTRQGTARKLSLKLQKVPTEDENEGRQNFYEKARTKK